MPLPYRRMSQIPDSLIHYVSELRLAGFFLNEGGNLQNVIMGIASRMMPGEQVGIPLDCAYFADENDRAMLTLTMNDRQQIAWELQLPHEEN